jgi:ERCC4-type nuclease
MDSLSGESGGLEPTTFKDLQTQILSSYQYLSNKKALNFFKDLSGLDSQSRESGGLASTTYKVLQTQILTSIPVGIKQKSLEFLQSSKRNGQPVPRIGRTRARDI